MIPLPARPGFLGMPQMNDRKASHLNAAACQRYTGQAGSESNRYPVAHRDLTQTVPRNPRNGRGHRYTGSGMTPRSGPM